MIDCLFCKIIKKEIPAEIVYEDKENIAFLDINSVNDGHTLVVPKQHFTDLNDISDGVLKSTIAAVKKVAVAVKKAVKADGINLGLNSERAAGQIVFHLHFHVIPRFEGDGFKHWHGKKASAEKLKEVAGKIKSLL